MPSEPFPPGSSLRHIANGGLTLSTASRLRRLKRWRGQTSFLGPADPGGGAREIAQVVGLSDVQAVESEPAYGWSSRAFARTSYGAALAQARRLAIGRLRQQAEIVGANAVIGITARWSEEEVALFGTAVELSGVPAGRPRLSLEDGQALAALRQAGVLPVTVVSAATQIWLPMDGTSLVLGRRPTSLGTLELADLTRVTAAARAEAVERLREQAAEDGASGVLGIQFGVRVRQHHGERPAPTAWVATAHAVGTAIERRSAPSRSAGPGGVTATLSLGDDPGRSRSPGSTGRHGRPGTTRRQGRPAGAPLLLVDAGYIEIGPLIGAAAFNTRPPKQPVRGLREVEAISPVVAEARRLALQRLRERAGAMGADLVIGVRCGTRRERGPWITEFVASGTAVRSSGGSGNPESSDPSLCTLDASDLWALRQRGLVPATVVIGSCVVPTRRAGLPTVGFRTVQLHNLENPAQTLARYEAYELVLFRMQQAAIDAGAVGITAAALSVHDHGWQGALVEHLCVGTAFRPRRSSHDQRATDAPPLRLDLTREPSDSRLPVFHYRDGHGE